MGCGCSTEAVRNQTCLGGSHTRFRPPRLATYNAASAAATNSCTETPLSGHTAKPILAVTGTLPP